MQRFIVTATGALVAAILCALGVFLAERCGRPTAADPGRFLVGRWYHAVPHNLIELTFHPDGIYTVDDPSWTGSWSYSAEDRTVSLLSGETSARGFVDNAGRLVFKDGMFFDLSRSLILYKERLMMQWDGSRLRVVENYAGSFFVALESESGVVVDAFECASRDSLVRLARKHGWRLPKDTVRP